MTTPRDPDARAQARLERDPGARPRCTAVHHQTAWLVPEPAGDLDPVALGVLLSTIPADDPRYVAARLAVELREQRRADVESSIAISEYVKVAQPDRHNRIPHAELERRRSTFDGVLDEEHLATRADPDRARRRRRAA